MNIHIGYNGKTEGPLTIDQVNERVRTGSLPFASTLAWYEGCKDWVPLRQVAGIVPPPAGVVPPPIQPQRPQGGAPQQQGDATGGLIPYKNAHALIAYYLGIFGLFPLVGLLLAIPALILGVMGFRKYRENPVISGSVHAWIGIILGSLSICYNGFFVVLMIIAMASKS